MNILTWNVNCFTAKRVAQKVRLLQLTDWDVALLQEVGESTFAACLEATGSEGAHAVALAGGARTARDHGVAVLVRGGRVAAAELFDAHDGLADDVGRRSTRGLSAVATINGVDLHVTSVHVYDAAGRDPQLREQKIARKMRFFEVLDAWCRATDGPTIVGGDFNTWMDPDEPIAIDDTDPFAAEHRFVVPGASHGLVDVQLAHLRANDSEALERRRQLGAVGMDGALAVTYQRSSRQHPRVSRMDRILASHHFHVRAVDTNYSDALTVGSDHAVVTAQLDLQPTTDRWRAGTPS